MIVNLKLVFDELNALHFDSALDTPELMWNSRLRAAAGRFIPGRRGFFACAPRIEVASYLLTELGGAELIRDTLGHEMIHFWLWARRKPYGHTGEFTRKMREMGVSRYNTVPRVKPPKYVYRCPGCGSEFPSRRRLSRLACAACCKAFGDGSFDSRFKLELFKSLTDPRP